MARLFYSSSLVLLSTLLPILTVQAHEAWPGNFTCPATTKQALAPTLKANGLCDCATGWTGPECGVCTTNEACAAVHGKGATCAQTSFAGEKKLEGFCEITSPAITDLLHGTGFVQMKYAPGDFSFLFLKRHDNTEDPTKATYIPIFRCLSDETTVTTNHGTGAVTYTSPDLSCELTCVVGQDRSCSAVLERVVKTVGVMGGSTIICDPFTKACQVKEMTLDTFIDGGVQTTDCLVSECIAPPAAATKTKPAAAAAGAAPAAPVAVAPAVPAAPGKGKLRHYA